MLILSRQYEEWSPRHRRLANTALSCSILAATATFLTTMPLRQHIAILVSMAAVVVTALALVYRSSRCTYPTGARPTDARR
ncbi:MAG: hypothetical protein K6T37_02330 [Acidothermus cellulolyticus]|nr:hypothetical protein [Acidothermus cellulolyticus]